MELMTNGQWVSVSEFAACMGISTTYVHRLAEKGKVKRVRVSDMSIEEFSKYGRGLSGTCVWAIWLPEDLMSIRVGAGRRKYRANKTNGG